MYVYLPNPLPPKFISLPLHYPSYPTPLILPLILFTPPLIFPLLHSA